MTNPSQNPSFSSSFSHEGIFQNTPQRFQKSYRKAFDVVHALQEMQRRGPRTLIGHVADTTYHLTQGYVVAQTDSGVVLVQGVPYGSVVAGMRIYCRQIGGMATNKRYVFDGFAPALSTLGTSGAVYVGNALPVPTTAWLSTATGSITTSSSINGAVGHYFTLFYFLSQLPLVGQVATLLQLTPLVSGTGITLNINVLPDGVLQVIDGNGHGYQTTTATSPHQLHWLVLQPGNTSGGTMSNELLIDGISFYTGILGDTDAVQLVGGGAQYILSLLSQNDGTQGCPIGSWVSKVGYGVCISPASSTLAPYPPGVPQRDTDLLVNPDTATGITPYGVYLFEEALGSTTFINSASSGGGTLASSLSSSPPAILQTVGPY